MFNARDLDFTEWLEVDCGTYRISRKLGRGKSTLMRFIRDRKELHDALSAYAQPCSLARASFFLWKTSSTPFEKTVNDMLKTRLYQMLKCRPSILSDLPVIPDGHIPAWTEQRRFQWFTITLETRFTPVDQTLKAILVPLCLHLSIQSEFDTSGMHLGYVEGP